MTNTNTKTVDEPDADRFYKWTVEIEINEVWVAGGFEITADRVQQMIQEAIGFARESETRVRVVASPDLKKIRKAQGCAVEAQGGA